MKRIITNFSMIALALLITAQVSAKQVYVRLSSDTQAWSGVTEAGHTQIAPGTTTCISIGAAPENLIDKITGELKLL